MENDTKLKQWLTGEVKFVIAVLGFGFGVVAPYFNITQNIALIQKDISIINTNHEAHIQDILVVLSKLKEDEVLIEKDLAITNQILIDHLNLSK